MRYRDTRYYRDTGNELRSFNVFQSHSLVITEIGLWVCSSVCIWQSYSLLGLCILYDVRAWVSKHKQEAKLSLG